MELIERVKNLLAEIDKTHRYSMSRIYGLYNEVFTVAEIPQSCASCLIRKVNELKKWLSQQTTDIVKNEVITSDEETDKNSASEATEAPLKKKRGRKHKSI